MENSILEFLTNGGDLVSKEGQKVIADATTEEIKEAATDQQYGREILSVFDKSTDVFARRNLLLALGEYIHT